MAVPPTAVGPRPLPDLSGAAVAFGAALLGAIVVLSPHAPFGQAHAVLLLAMLAGGVLAAYVVANVPLSWSISAGTFLSLFGSNWTYLGLPRLVAPDRIVLGLVVLAVVVRAPSARGLPPIRRRGVHTLMLLVAVYALGSALVADVMSNRTALFALSDRVGLLAFAVFVVAPAAFATRQDRRVFLGTMVAIGIYLGATALFETLGLTQFIFPRYINDPTVGIHFGRARGPFLQAAVNGLAMYACLVASLVAWREFRGRTGARLLTLIAIVLCAIGPMFTLERSIWTGTTVATVLTMLSARELRRYLIPVVAVAALAVVAALAFIPNLEARANARRQNVGSIQGRQALNDAAVNMIKARPLLGFGWFQFVPRSVDYFQTSDSYRTRVQPGLILHNAYLANAVELGLLGGSLWFLALMVGVGGPAFRRGPPSSRPWRLACRALLLLWLFVAVASPLLGAYQGLILWLFAGIVNAVDDEAAGTAATAPS